MNPHALVGGPIRILPRGGHGSLFPWILERFPWVFEHELCQENPPHLELVKAFGDDRCCLETLRKFYELYPQGLREKGKRDPISEYPLSLIVGGFKEPDADFVIWMAKQYPEAVYHEYIPGFTVLHKICSEMAAKENDFIRVPFKATPNMAKICRYFVSEHPSLVRKQGHGHGPLPIHELAKRCNQPVVQEMILLLLKAYLKSFFVHSVYDWHPDLANVPFIQQIYPLILHESIIDKEISTLTQTSKNMRNAAALSRSQLNASSGPTSSALNSSLFDSVAEVFCSWANLRVSDILARKRRIEESITDICRRAEGEDVPDDDEELEYIDEGDWDDDRSSEFESEDSDDMDESEKDDESEDSYES